MKILLVEDDEMSRDMLSRRLLRSGFSVVTAENGQLAVEEVRRDPPDLILMDLSLPVLDGWAATAQIRALEIKQMPIIALTANVMSGEKEKAFTAGCNGYETKPVAYERLLATINELIAKG